MMCADGGLVSEWCATRTDQSAVACANKRDWASARWWQMTDLEGDVARVWSSDVRPLVHEAWRCYNAGAIRAAIASTWTAVAADLIEKITRLADSGDAEAKALGAENMFQIHRAERSRRQQSNARKC